MYAPPVGGTFIAVDLPTAAVNQTDRDLFGCVFIFAFVWLVFLGLALLTLDVFRVAWMQLEGIDDR